MEARLRQDKKGRLLPSFLPPDATMGMGAGGDALHCYVDNLCGAVEAVILTLTCLRLKNLLKS